jgi:hypothetical protein
MSPALAAMIFCALFAVLSVFQLALAFGAPLGRFAWGGGHERLPTSLRIGSLVSIALYAVFCAIVAERAGLAMLFPMRSISDIGIWVVTGYLGLGIAMNAISRSRPERLTMTPVVAVLFGLALVVALSPPPLV